MNLSPSRLPWHRPVACGAILASLVLALAGGQPLRAAEPTNAAEAAAKKAEADRRTDELYQQKKATLSPERQAWEALLEQNLGNGFYLPIHKRDFVKGVSTAWDFVADDPKLPRVLLIGDSVSRGYTLPVRAALAGRANVHRAPENCGPTANGLKKIEVWLGNSKWDLIHFNFGIHDRATPEADYEARLEQLTQRLAQTGARLVWASSTPLPAQSTYGSDTAIAARNAIATKVMRKHGVVIDDLYGWIRPELAEYQNPNDVHFSGTGYQRLAERVARVIDVALPRVAGVNSALVPAGKIEVDGYLWEARHAAVMKIKDSLRPEVVLIGDSITHFWGGEPDGGKSGNRGTDSWQALFGARRALNLGFGWDRTQNVLRRIELGELDGLAPQAVVIHIGTNNLAATSQARANTAEEIAAAIAQIVERVQVKCPRAQVILMAIFPRGPGASNPQRAVIADINQRLAPLGQKPRITLLDITAKWLQPDGAVDPALMPGLLHPNAQGYAVWADALRAVLPP